VKTEQNENYQHDSSSFFDQFLIDYIPIFDIKFRESLNPPHGAYGVDLIFLQRNNALTP
jgi:hypothetical protein